MCNGSWGNRSGCRPRSYAVLFQTVPNVLQERSLKAQYAALEKRQHESWVTARQEGRKIADAQSEMQVLRSRLTVAETKLLESEVNLRQVKDENQSLKESLENISSKHSSAASAGIVKGDGSEYDVKARMHLSTPVSFSRIPVGLSRWYEHVKMI